MEAPVHEAELDARPPQADETWFRELPLEHRERIEAEWRANRDHDDRLERDARRRDHVDRIRFAVLFPLGDLLLCPHHSAWTFAAAIAAGWALAMLLVRFDAERLMAGTCGAVAIFLFQLVTRGGLSAWHLWAFFPVAAAYALAGYAREDRAFG